MLTPRAAAMAASSRSIRCGMRVWIAEKLAPSAVALLGGYLFAALGISSYGLLGALITATVGAIVLIALIRLVRKAPGKTA